MLGNYNHEIVVDFKSTQTERELRNDLAGIREAMREPTVGERKVDHKAVQKRRERNKAARRSRQRNR